jgi:hypothetical protein
MRDIGLKIKNEKKEVNRMKKEKLRVIKWILKNVNVDSLKICITFSQIKNGLFI